MKLKHWVFVGLAITGGLFALHLMMSHGGVQGFKAGIGLG